MGSALRVLAASRRTADVHGAQRPVHPMESAEQGQMLQGLVRRNLTPIATTGAQSHGIEQDQAAPLASTLLLSPQALPQSS